MLDEVSAPNGMTGLVCEPWSPDEIYGVAANWAQASSPVWTYGWDGWTLDEHGRQVADFRHRPKDALESILLEAIQAGGDDPDDREIEAILSHAIEI